jgi:hypothetical protein
MRNWILAVVGTVVAFLAASLSERFLSEHAPEWVVRLAYSVIAIGGATWLLFSDSIYKYVKNPSAHELVSTLILAVFAGVVVATTWFFWFVGWPSSTPYANALVERWLQQLSHPWVVTQVSGRFYVDNSIDRLGVEISRPEDYVVVSGGLALVGDRLQRFNSLPSKEKKVQILTYLPHTQAARSL